MQIDGVILKPLDPHTDQRGWLLECWRSDETEHCPAMAYVSLTKPGVSRGPHEHLYQADYFVFLTGQWCVRLWDNRDVEALDCYAFHIDGPSSLVVPPGVVHAYTNVGPTDGLVLNLPDQLYRGEGRLGHLDEIRHEDDATSPFNL